MQNNQDISAKVIAHSVTKEGQEIITFELEYPRFIHAEVMTHRVFSRNAQSSRAVPVKNTLAVNSKPVEPLVWGKNKAGMSSTEVLEGFKLHVAKLTWSVGAWVAKQVSSILNWAGLHKQWANRSTEPYSRIKVVLTTTEIENFYWLRLDKEAAQPEIIALAEAMQKAHNQSEPNLLHPGQWHLPYISSIETPTRQLYFTDWTNTESISLEDARKISASACAQVSYRKLDTSIEKALGIYERLFSGPKPHLSPTEHQAAPIDYESEILYALPNQCWTDGITHLDRDGKLWSGNFKSWIQYRQLI
jgi:hypothetical protein